MGVGFRRGVCIYGVGRGYRTKIEGEQPFLIIPLLMEQFSENKVKTFQDFIPSPVLNSNSIIFLLNFV